MRILLSRWSSRRRAAVALGATALGVLVTMLVGIALGERRLAAAIALGVVALGLGYVLVLAARGLRRRAEQISQVGGPSALGSGSSLPPIGDAEHRPLVESATARRSRALEVLAGESWVTRQSFEVASHARSLIAAELLSALATHGRLSLERLIEVTTSDSDRAAIDGVVGPVARDTGPLLARWLLASPDSSTRRAGAVLARIIVDQGGDRATGDATRLRLAHGLVVQGDLEGALLWLRGLDPQHFEARLLRLDIDRASGALATEAWAAALAALFEQAGLEPVSVDDDALSPFDGLRATAPAVAYRDDDPLVTVVMSCYEPDSTILAAVRSIVNQSWSRWELLVMDDASRGADSVLEQVAALDPRIRVIRSEHNTGTYGRRNEAMDLARGTLITAHDSDDWAHPRRLELQVRHLQANPSVLANVSESLRVDPQLGFAQPRASGLRLTEATIMFRAEPVMRSIGYYDGVRRAADSEFRLRLEAVAGYRLPIIRIGAPLTLVRSRADSLSGGDFADQWMHPARVAYRSAMTHWLRARLDAGADVRIEHPQIARPFPAHPHLTGASADGRPFDVLIVGDTRASSAFARDRLSELVARASEAGGRVGLRRLEDVARGGPREATADSLQQLISAGRVDEVLATDRVAARTVIVAGDRCLLGLGERDEPIDAGEVRVIAEASGALQESVRADVLPMLVGTAAVVAVDWATALDAVPTRGRQA